MCQILARAFLFIVFLSLPGMGRSQTPTVPAHWISATSIDEGYLFFGVKLPNNKPEEIRQELLDSQLLRTLGKSEGLSESDLATVKVGQEPGASWPLLYQISKPDKAYRVLSNRLRAYARARQEGHTKEFALAASTNQLSVSVIPDSDMRVLLKSYPSLNVNLLKKVDSGRIPIKAGEVKGESVSVTIINGKAQTNVTRDVSKRDELSRWVKYVLMDGEIAWIYSIQFKPDGSLWSTGNAKADAKEYDPRYKEVFKEVESEIEVEMKRRGIFGTRGAVHTKWLLEKEKLKTRGIEWRSPAELNPLTRFD